MMSRSGMYCGEVGELGYPVTSPDVVQLIGIRWHGPAEPANGSFPASREPRVWGGGLLLPHLSGIAVPSDAPSPRVAGYHVFGCLWAGRGCFQNRPFVWMSVSHTHTWERLCVLGLSTSRPSVLSLHSLAVADQETQAGTTRTLVSAAIRSEMLCLVCIFTCLCSVNSSDVLVRLMASSMCL